MHIAIEAQRLFRPDRHGMDLVALELIRRLPAAAPDHRFVVLSREGPHASSLSGVHGLRTMLLPGITYADWEQLSLPRAVSRIRPDLLHCTANTGPLAGSAPLVLTLHDIIFLETAGKGGSVYQQAGNRYRRWLLPRLLKKAAALITVSEHEKQTMAERLEIGHDKIHVITNGVDGRFHGGFSQEDVERFREETALPPQYLLFLGNTAPKKNTAGVLKAYAHYCEHNADALPLVIADFAAVHLQKILRDINKVHLVHKIRLAGYVSPEKMPLLYSASTLFLYPSLRESFGLPVLEAMASGVPVITSLTSALPETAGNAALLVNPEDPIAISAAISELLTDTMLRNEFIQKGKARALLFDWDKSVHALIKLYESLT